MSNIGTQAVVQIPAKNKGIWEPIVDVAQNLCRNRDLYCGITIGWKEVWVFGKESTVFMTIATITHPATAENKTRLAEVVRRIAELVAHAD